jgi:hypothetical protein
MVVGHLRLVLKVIFPIYEMSYFSDFGAQFFSFAGGIFNSRKGKTSKTELFFISFVP